MKKNIGILIAPLFLLHVSCTEGLKSNGTAQAPLPVRNLHAEKAFKEIDSLKAYFCSYPEECEQYENLSYIEQRRYEEKVTKNRSHLAQNFLDSFPNDGYYHEVLTMFFNLNFEPRFLEVKIPDSLSYFFSKEIQFGTPEYYKRLRALPIDVKAKNEWLDKGYSLAEKFLQSDAPLEKKLKIEIAVHARDLRQAYELYNSLNMRRNNLEAVYWMEFDEQYWDSFRLRMNDLIEKYGESDSIATYVEGFISIVSKKSPNLTEIYWEKFLAFTDANHPISDKNGFKTIHKMAKTNLEALKTIDESKPLEMKLTTTEGKKINLADIRGKVVLIDFWTTRCPPCIKEMPHVQAMYEKYKSQGFEVIGLASNGDNSKKRVLEIIQKQGATWPQILDKSENAVISYHSLYNIRSYPTVWLLNKQGIIVDKNARGNRLEPLIRKYLDLDNY